MSLTEKIYNKFLEKKMDGKTPVMIDNTLASINLVRSKIEKNLFVISLISTCIFLGFYGYMIYANIVGNGTIRLIVYSSLAIILIVSTIFDIMFYPGKLKNMNFIDKKKMKENKKLKRDVLLVIKTIIKALSLGYALYEILVLDSSKSKIILLILSTIAFIFQLIVYFVSDLIVRYANYIMMGINLDIENSGAYIMINKDSRDIIKANQLLRTKDDEEVIKEIKEQAAIDKKNKINDVALKKNIANRSEEL